MDPLNGVGGLSLMPAPGDDGQMLQRSLESDEASNFREFSSGDALPCHLLCACSQCQTL